ncbi:MAG: hypothetical protein RLY14_3059, partial [Planctomycetota bacterium]
MFLKSSKVVVDYGKHRQFVHSEHFCILSIVQMEGDR